MSIARHHAEWLSLVEVSGPFLSMPVLLAAFRDGLEAHDPDHHRLLRLAHDEWEAEANNRAIHDAWVHFVLRKTLDFAPEALLEDQKIPQTLHAEVAEQHEILKPNLVLKEPASDKPRLLIQTYPATQELTKPVPGVAWKASPDTRMTELLHATGVRLGLVTNGERWMLVDAPRGETTGYASWYATLWLEEPITLRAFRSLLGLHRFFGVNEKETLEELLKKSAANQQEVTDQLGYQVRKAVEVLIQSLDRADQDHGRELLQGVSEAELYEAALTIMMRLVFLFCAEERELLLLGDPLYNQNYALSTIREQLRTTADQFGEEVLERRHDAWCRLLVTFRAVHGGVWHDNMKLPAYGGRLFDPDRFPFLEGRKPGTTWRVTGDGWRESTQGEFDGGSALSGTGGLAVGDGSRRTMLHGDTDLSQGGTVRDDQPDSPSSSGHPGEHRRGTGTGTHQGVSQLPEHHAGISHGTGDPSSFEPASGTSRPAETRTPSGTDRPHQPNADRPAQDPGKAPLIPPPATHHPPRFQEARPLPVNNRTVLHLLEALQVLQVKVPGGGPAEARRLSFRALDIEQIGHVYEGLLDHTARRAGEPYLGLAGTKDKEPEITLAKLDELRAKGEKDLFKFLKDATGRSEAALRKALKTESDAQAVSRFRSACQGETLWHRVQPFAGLVRLDTCGYPVVIPKGSVFVTAGTDRRSSGTHYTPRELTEPIVKYTLEPLVYVGPAEGAPKAEWKLKPARELLDLKICDMACGSGAFLVQACRYLSERLLEAWEQAEWRVASGEWREKTTGGQDECATLSGTQGLAGGDGPGRTVLSGDQTVPQGGTLRNDQPDSEGGGFDPGEHCRGAGATSYQGIPQSPEHRQGIADGTGNSSTVEQSSRVAPEAGPGKTSGVGGPNQPDAHRAAPGARSETLISRHSPLATRHPLRITPYGLSSEGGLYEQLVPLDLNERLTYARRIIAQRCLYGVDKNPLATEMAKLSLWLLTLAKDKPFEFLDHAIRCGDSLVGIHHLDQLKHFNLNPSQGHNLFTGPIFNLVDEAVALRQKIEAMPSNTVEDVEAQEKLLEEAEEKTARLRCAADLLLSVKFQGVSAADKQSLHDSMAIQAGYHVENGTIDEFRHAGGKALKGQQTFHWPLEFPEVFQKRGGFDAFVCNPPFMGGSKITGSLGTSYRDYLVNCIATGKRGNADLCAYFFLRARTLLRELGGFGFLATNTIAQGDTREVGLDQLLSEGCTIPRAVSTRQWPGEATLEVAEVWLCPGQWRGNFVLDERPVSGITGFLTEASELNATPFRLVRSLKKCFMGTFVHGLGFILDPAEVQTLIEKDPRNKDVLFPYINGEDLNSTPDQFPTRWVINFADWPLERKGTPKGYTGPVAEDYPDCLGIVREKVRPQRLTNPDRRLRELWWRFKRPVFDLYEAIKGQDRVLARARIANLHSLVWLPNGWIYNDKTYVFVCCSFAVLQSSLHEIWARKYSSTLRTDMQYTSTDCFETFPFPQVTGEADPPGEEYHEHRRQVMLARQEGLTKTYNRFHDSEEANDDIQKLRQLHVEMDQAVAAAYGWTGLDLGHDFHQTKQGLRYTISEPARREVLARLLKLNHERYEEEVRQGLHEKKKARRPGKPKTRANSEEDGGLFH
jgi:Eco57I restriction-modification methylase/MmeI, target recognition domain/MmeI, N-terminal domain